MKRIEFHQQKYEQYLSSPIVSMCDPMSPVQTGHRRFAKVCSGDDGGHVFRGVFSAFISMVHTSGRS